MPENNIQQPVEVAITYPEGMRPVGVWYRFLARFLDGIFLGIIGSPLLLVVFFIAFRASIDATNNNLDKITYTPQQSMVIGLCSLGYLIITICYQVFLTSSKLQGTLAKRILGIKVVDESGSRISAGRAFTRYLATDGLGVPYSLLGNSTNALGKGVASVFGFFAFIYTIIDASVGGGDLRKRTVHDRIAKTYVVYR